MHAHMSALERVLGLPELQIQIERYLAVRDLSRCCQVSRFFHTLWNRTVWSKIRTDRHGLPEFLDKYCLWVESWERLPTMGGYAFLDEMEQVRTSCCYLSDVHIHLPVADPCGFLRHFMGLTEEGVEEGGSWLEGGLQKYRNFQLFIPGRVVFFENDDDEGTLTRQWIQDQEDHQPPRQFIPQFSHPEDAPLAPGLPNAFLSSWIRTLELSSPETYLPLLDWLTRAAIEGHLQGLERFKFLVKGQCRWQEGWTTSRSSILQFLGACPRLVVYDAPDIIVKGDEPRALLNADVATAYPTGPWKASHFHARDGSWRRMIPLQELNLATINLNSTDNEQPDDVDVDTLNSKDTLLLEFFLHLPKLVRLTVNDNVADERLVQALEMAYHPRPPLPTATSTFPDRIDYDAPVPVFPPCEGSPAKFFSIQDPMSRGDQSVGYYQLEHFSQLDQCYQRGDPTPRSWARFVTFPWLRLSKLEFSRLSGLPRNFLEILSGQESIRRHLKSFLISLEEGQPSWVGRNVDVEHHFKARSISHFMSACGKLREIKLPIADLAQSGFFTVKESDTWNRPSTPLTGGGVEEQTGCRDKLEVVTIWGVRLDSEDNGSMAEHEAFREWMASLKSLRSLSIEGLRIQLNALIDLSIPSVSPVSSSSEKEESVCGQLRELQISANSFNTRLTVGHVQQLARRMPKLRMLNLPTESFEPEAEDWIAEYCPRLSPFVDDDDDDD